MRKRNKGLEWMRAHGRPIEQGLVSYVRDGDASSLKSALGAFANDDGGFGRALEPDVRLQDSSVLATTVGLQVLSLCRAPASEPLVAGAMKYLGTAFNPEARAWPIVPANVDDAPHAPWWDYKDLSGYMVNPRAEIVGYMYTWPEYFDTALRDELTQALRTLLLVAEELEMHDILVFDRLLRSPGLPPEFRAELETPFQTMTLAAVCTDPADWGSYQLSPLSVVKSPQHPLASEFEEVIQANLDHMLDKQEDDGSWSPTWSWYGRYPDDWPTAERDIRSKVTADTLCVLHRFGRLD